VEVFVAAGHELYVTPLPNREMLVAALAEGALREPFEVVFRRWCSSERELAVRLEGAEQVTPLMCTSPLAGGARRGVAPGIVLLGDAAGFLDPITGGGMTQALMTAELLAQYMRTNFRRGRVTASAEIGNDGWLWDFERDRKRMLADYRRLTRMVLWLADHPRLAERLIGTLRVAPGILSHLIGVSGGMRPLFGLLHGGLLRGGLPRGAN
jgi:2-polyprenyl-6-methoxyphenol hydroxylase-like FAD-dependent oxidoreductase